MCSRRAVVSLLLSLLLFSFLLWWPLPTRPTSSGEPVLSKCGLGRTFERSNGLIVVARQQDEDITWLDVCVTTPHLVFQAADASVANPVPQSERLEVATYLQFILQHYACLPASVAFIGSHRGSWHLHDKVPVLQQLRWSELGFASLRPYRSWEWERADWRRAVLTSIAGRLQSAFPPHVGETPADADPADLMASRHLSPVWDELFADELGKLPPVLHADGFSEFIVSRDRILSHPRIFYQRLLDWIVENSRTHASPDPGRYIFEHLWGYIFGESAVTYQLTECELLNCDYGCHEPSQLCNSRESSGHKLVKMLSGGGESRECEEQPRITDPQPVL